MAVPAEIRAVPRPKNTVVQDTGREGPKRYPVREREKVLYVRGGNPQPHNGKTVGHIVNGQFVPLHGRPAHQGASELSYGAAALVHSVCDDIKQDLMDVCDVKDVYSILSIAYLKIIKPGISIRRYTSLYERTFVSQYFPGIGLSYKTTSDLFKRLGQDVEMCRRFYEKRLTRVADDQHIAIDGTLKQDTSSINDLSNYSHKARVKGCKDISVLYAYSIELREPVCAQVFPGNSIDATSYREFIKSNQITHGIIVADKGFPPSKIAEEVAQNEALHYLTPIKNNDKRIQSLKLLKFDGVLKGMEKPIAYRKCKVSAHCFLYAFLDARRAGAEHTAYLQKAAKEGSFDLKKYEKDREKLGLIVFESDLDLDPKLVYETYDDRWLLELVFHHYKADEGLDKTNVQGDFSVMGAEFVNFIATIATCRIIEKMRASGLLNEMSYGDIMDDLNSAWRKIGTATDPREDDDAWVHTIPKVHKQLIALGLSKAAAIPVCSTPNKMAGKVKKQRPSPEEFVGPRRPRGRPRTKPRSETSSAPKRGRGRPRKTPTLESGSSPEKL